MKPAKKNPVCRRRNKVWERDKFTNCGVEYVICVWCTKHVEKTAFTVDHLIPLSRGGTHGLANLVSSCLPCNQRKGDQLPRMAIVLAALQKTAQGKPVRPKKKKRSRAGEMAALQPDPDELKDEAQPR